MATLAGLGNVKPCRALLGLTGSETRSHMARGDLRLCIAIGLEPLDCAPQGRIYRDGFPSQVALGFAR